MPAIKRTVLALSFFLGVTLSANAAETPLPAAIASPGETVVLTAHAEGAQVYECKATADGKLAWAFQAFWLNCANWAPCLLKKVSKSAWDLHWA